MARGPARRLVRAWWVTHGSQPLQRLRKNRTLPLVRRLGRRAQPGGRGTGARVQQRARSRWRPPAQGVPGGGWAGGAQSTTVRCGLRSWEGAAPGAGGGEVLGRSCRWLLSWRRGTGAVLRLRLKTRAAVAGVTGEVSDNSVSRTDQRAT